MNQKLLSNSSKGYLQIDFAFAVLILFLFIFLAYNMYSSYAETQVYNYDAMIVEKQSKDLCKLLISSPGSPTGWNNFESTNFIGLKSHLNSSLSSAKINALSSTKYYNFTSKLNINQEIHLKLSGVITNSTYLDFGFKSEGADISAKNSCFGYYENETVKLVVEVWK